MVKPYQAHFATLSINRDNEFRPRRCGAEVRIEYATQKSFNTVKLNGEHIPIDGANQNPARTSRTRSSSTRKVENNKRDAARARIEHKTSRRDIPVIRDWYAAER